MRPRLRPCDASISSTARSSSCTASRTRRASSAAGCVAMTPWAVRWNRGRIGLGRLPLSGAFFAPAH